MTNTPAHRVQAHRVQSVGVTEPVAADHLDPSNGGAGAGVHAAPSTHEVLASLGAALLAGDRDALETLLAGDVVALVPGRHRAAGVHRGPTAVVDALMVAPPPGVRVVGIDVTEVLVEGSRGLLVIGIQAALDADADAVVAFEVAFHVQCDRGLVIGITEYAGDQHAIDELLGT
ncbi:MAG: hypothetical protein AAFY28_20060 [Actinomycetota bacterium]